MTFPDGTKISVSDFDDLSFAEQQDFCLSHGVDLSFSGDLNRYASGIPGNYSHLVRAGIDLDN